MASSYLKYFAASNEKGRQYCQSQRKQSPLFVDKNTLKLDITIRHWNPVNFVLKKIE